MGIKIKYKVVKIFKNDGWKEWRFYNGRFFYSCLAYSIKRRRPERIYKSKQLKLEPKGWEDLDQKFEI